MAGQEKPPILVVDDEPDILFSLRGLLRTDFTVFTANSGTEAIELLRDNPVHVIMTDQRMPGMTGAEMLSRVRATCPEAIRMIFTGYADIKAVIEAINHGGVHRYLVKPWDPDELREALLDACQRYTRQMEAQRLLTDSRDFVAGSLALIRKLAIEPTTAGDESIRTAVQQLTQVGQALSKRLENVVS